MALFEPAIQQALDDDGDPIGGAVWYFYTTGGLTPAAVYADDLLVTSLGSSVTANASGRFANIYLDDAVTYRAILKDGVAGSTIKDIDPISPNETADSISGWWADVNAFGADNTGVADCASAINAAIATGKDVFLPKGTYKVASALTQLATGQAIFGTGPQSILRFTANDRCISVGHRSIVRDLAIVGDGKGAGKTFQTGVFCFQKYGWQIKDCEITDVSGAGQENGGGAIAIGLLAALETEGGRVSGCRIYNNNGGLNYSNRGEYIITTNCLVTSNTIGVYAAAGNLSFTNCNIQHNTIGIKLFSATNDGHGSFTGCLVNHNATTLTAASIINGFSFTNCHLYIGDITLTDCIGFRFVNCDIAGQGYTFTLAGTCTGTQIAHSRLPLDPTLDFMTLTLNGNTLTQVSNVDF